MTRGLIGFLQEAGGKAKDHDQQVAGIADLTHSLRDQHPSCAAAVHGGLLDREAMQKPAEGTRHTPALQQGDEAIAAKEAEHERRSAAARKAWITIRLNKAAAEDANLLASLTTSTGKASRDLLSTGPIHQAPPAFSTQSSNNVGKPFHERGGKAEITTAESERIPDPAPVSESEEKPKKRKPPGVKAKEEGTPLKRGAAVQVVTYPRPETKAVLVRAARQHDQSLSSYLILAGLEKEANRRECEVKNLVPPHELHQYN